MTERKRLPIPAPADVLKWSGVLFAVCIEILVVVAIILAMFGVF